MRCGEQFLMAGWKTYCTYVKNLCWLHLAFIMGWRVVRSIKVAVEPSFSAWSFTPCVIFRSPGKYVPTLKDQAHQNQGASGERTLRPFSSWCKKCRLWGNHHQIWWQMALLDQTFSLGSEVQTLNNNCLLIKSWMKCLPTFQHSQSDQMAGLQWFGD